MTMKTKTRLRVVSALAYADGTVSIRLRGRTRDVYTVATFQPAEVVWLLQEATCGVLVALERGWSATVPAELCSEVALAFGLRAVPATPAA